MHWTSFTSGPSKPSTTWARHFLPLTLMCRRREDLEELEACVTPIFCFILITSLPQNPDPPSPLASATLRSGETASSPQFTTCLWVSPSKHKSSTLSRHGWILSAGRVKREDSVTLALHIVITFLRSSGKRVAVSPDVRVGRRNSLHPALPLSRSPLPTPNQVNSETLPP